MWYSLFMPDLTKFQRIVERLMTDEEVKERAKEMNLSEKTTEFIVGEFAQVHDRLSSREEDTPSEEFFARGNGRLGCFQSHEEVYLALGEAMDVALEWGESDVLVDRVWEAFFDE